MSSLKFPPCPPQLKALQHYMKLALDYDTRQPVISYWARLYALQSALKIDRKSAEARALLTALMDWLEEVKKVHHENDAITSDVAGQAIIENEAHKLFSAADAADRSANFNKNLVKTFYTCGVLYDICEVFGELPEEIAAQRKYAKWKATYIHNCLKSGERPVPGPVGGDEDEFPSRPEVTAPHSNLGFGNSDSVPSQPSDPGFNLPPISNAPYVPDATPSMPSASIPSGYQMPNAAPQASAGMPSTMSSSGSGVSLDAKQCGQVQKYCKYAISSLDYEDTPTAIGYLTKALNLLTIGKESP